MEKKFCPSYKCFLRHVFLFEDLWHTNIMNIIEKTESLLWQEEKICLSN